MARYEYKVEVVGSSSRMELKSEIAADLTRAAAEGWRFVAFVPDSGRLATAVFEKEAKQT